MPSSPIVLIYRVRNHRLTLACSFLLRSFFFFSFCILLNPVSCEEGRRRTSFQSSPDRKVGASKNICWDVTCLLLYGSSPFRVRTAGLLVEAGTLLPSGHFWCHFVAFLFSLGLRQWLWLVRGVLVMPSKKFVPVPGVI